VNPHTATAEPSPVRPVIDAARQMMDAVRETQVRLFDLAPCRLLPGADDPDDSSLALLAEALDALLRGYDALRRSAGRNPRYSHFLDISGY
jgi:hypothetical protein